MEYTRYRKQIPQAIFLGFSEPEFDYNDKASFIVATGKCVDFLNFTNDRLSRVPTSMIIAMAGVESGWGSSRFANEGNALFGVRTWDTTVPQMKAKENPNAKWGVKKYATKCDSVKDMIRILNNHPAYEDFRKEREKQLNTGKWDYKQLLLGITAWSTNPDYVKIIWTAIVDNNLP
jgi:Bax protein